MCNEGDTRAEEAVQRKAGSWKSSRQLIQLLIRRESVLSMKFSYNVKVASISFSSALVNRSANGEGHV
jgi:hypothetical protein